MSDVDPPPIHIPVLPQEILDYGKPTPGQFWVDGTGGAGGHSALIAEALGDDGVLLSVDRDPKAAEHLEATLPANSKVENASYHEVPRLIQGLGLPLASGILLDLGLSSDQLADRERGFSFRSEGELDMRYDPTEGEPAWRWLKRSPEKEIANAIYRYGEERFSRRIARRIVERRRTDPIRTAAELCELIHRCVPTPRRHRGAARHGNVDPATRTFQALRIVVNRELDILEKALAKLPDSMEEGGQILVISFHSLEDRIVKHAFREDYRLEVVTKKPVQAGEAEVSTNPRSRSAKLRVAKKVAKPLWMDSP